MEFNINLFNEYLPIEKIYDLRPWSSSDAGKIIYCEKDDNFYFGTKTTWFSLKPGFHNLFSFGYSGGTGVTGHFGKRGLIGSTGGTGGTGMSGGTGRRGFTGGKGGRGTSIITGGSGGSGRTGGTGLSGDILSIHGDLSEGSEYGVFEIDFIGVDNNSISIEVRNIYNAFEFSKKTFSNGQIIDGIYYSGDKSEVTLWYTIPLPKSFKVSSSIIVYNDTGKDLKIYSTQFITFRLFHSLDGTFKQFTPIISSNKKITLQVTYIKAYSQASEHILTVIIVGDDNAIVVSEPEGINCKNICEYKFLYRTTVKLTVQPSEMYEVDRWIGCDTSIRNISYVKIVEDILVIVILRLIKYKLIVEIQGHGTVQDLTFNKINCSSLCSAEYEINNNIELKPTPDTNYVFKKWIYNDKINGNNAIMIMDSDKTVTAVFTLMTFKLSVYKKILNSTIFSYTNLCGNITSDDGHISCGSECEYNYDINSNVILTRTVNADFIFINWVELKDGIENVLSIDSSITFNMLSDKIIYVNYKVNPTLHVKCITLKPPAVYYGEFSVNSGEHLIYVSSKYPINTQINLESFPSSTSGVSFGYWAKADSFFNQKEIITHNSKLQISLTDDVYYVAVYEKDIKLTILFGCYNYSSPPEYNDLIVGGLYESNFWSKITDTQNNINLQPGTQDILTFDFIFGTQLDLNIESTDKTKFRYVGYSIDDKHYWSSTFKIYKESNIKTTLTQHTIIYFWFAYKLKFGLKNYNKNHIHYDVYRFVNGQPVKIPESLTDQNIYLDFEEHVQIKFNSPLDPSDNCYYYAYQPYFVIKNDTGYALHFSKGNCDGECFANDLMKTTVDRDGDLGSGYIPGVVDFVVDSYEEGFESQYQIESNGFDFYASSGFMFSFDYNYIGQCPASSISHNEVKNSYNAGFIRCIPYLTPNYKRMVAVHNIDLSSSRYCQLMPFNDMMIPYDILLFNTCVIISHNYELNALHYESGDGIYGPIYDLKSKKYILPVLRSEKMCDDPKYKLKPSEPFKIDKTLFPNKYMIIFFNFRSYAEYTSYEQIRFKDIVDII